MENSLVPSRYLSAVSKYIRVMIGPEYERIFAVKNNNNDNKLLLYITFLNKVTKRYTEKTAR